MILSRAARIWLGTLTSLVLALIYLPLAVVIINSFNSSRTFAWPPPGLTLAWWGKAAQSQGLRDSLWNSIQAGLFATLFALILGTMLASAVARFSFFGRETLSLLVVLPLALPGIVTGVALSNTITTVLHPLGISAGLFTVVVGHATFCMVVVYNNVLARLRRTGGTLEEASADLGADRFRTFRLVTFPLIRSALLAGALLAFALSFDEIIVTTFTAGNFKTLPLWIFENLFRPNQAPVINVAAAALIVLAIAPVWLAHRLGGDAAGGRL